jgi:hypothetical protein
MVHNVNTTMKQRVHKNLRSHASILRHLNSSLTTTKVRTQNAITLTQSTLLSHRTSLRMAIVSRLCGILTLDLRFPRLQAITRRPPTRGSSLPMTSLMTLIAMQRSWTDPHQLTLAWLPTWSYTMTKIALKKHKWTLMTVIGKRSSLTICICKT